jgi:hypothetical protein
MEKLKSQETAKLPNIPLSLERFSFNNERS